MARKVTEIKDAMTNEFIRDSAVQTAYGISYTEGETFYDYFSRASIESILFYVFALCAYTIERLTETHLREITSIVGALRPHTLEWYSTKALSYQDGHNLSDGSDSYDNTGIDDSDVQKAKVVKQVAVIDSTTESGLIIKVAGTDDDDNLCQLQSEQLSRFTTYISRIKDAGIRTTVISRPPDRLYLKLTVYVDAAVIDNKGMTILTGERPVEMAIRQYLTMLPFNGELVTEHLIDHLQTVAGVEIPHLEGVMVSRVSDNSQGNGYTPLAALADNNIRDTPNSGYYVVSFDKADEWCSSITYKTK